MINAAEEAFFKGDEGSVDMLIERYAPLAAALISNIAGGRLTNEDMEEAVADTFSTLWFSRESISPGPLRAYICAIAKNKARDMLRSKSRDNVVSLEEDIEDELMISEGLERREVSEKLKAALQGLPTEDREIVLRHYYFYQSTAVIAEKMSMNQKTVQTRLIRARKKLRQLLTEMGVEL